MIKFEVNESQKDRAIRYLVGGFIVLISYFMLTETLQIIGLIFGIMLIFTAYTGFCGIYRILGVSTSKKSKKNNLNN